MCKGVRGRVGKPALLVDVGERAAARLNCRQTWRETGREALTQRQGIRT